MADRDLGVGPRVEADIDRAQHLVIRRSPAAQKRRHRRFSADLGGAAHVGEDVVAGTLGAYAGTFDEGQFVIGNVIDFDLDSGTYTIA